MAGLLLCFWSASMFTVGHLLWAGGLTGYIVLGTVLEERDLVARFGAAYRHYATEVPAFFPLTAAHLCPSPYPPVTGLSISGTCRNHCVRSRSTSVAVVPRCAGPARSRVCATTLGEPAVKTATRTSSVAPQAGRAAVPVTPGRTSGPLIRSAEPRCRQAVPR